MIILLTANFLGSFGTFLALPLLPLILQQKLHLSATAIGMVCSVWPGTVFFSSWFSGSIMERIGYRASVLLGFALCSAGFGTAALASQTKALVLALALFGVGKTFSDSAIRASISALCEPEERPRMYRIRYLVLNVATVVAPLAGAFLFSKHSSWVLPMTAAFYALAWGLCLAGLKAPSLQCFAGKERRSWSSHHLLINDRGLQFWVLSTLLILLVYGGFETLMPLVAEKTSKNIPLLGPLMSLNAIVVILVQLIPFKDRTYRREILRARFGFGAFVLGFALFAVFHGVISGLILGTIVYSLGESLLFPCFDMLMDKLAPSGAKASYFAIGEVKQIGFLLGPVLAGVVYDWSGASALFGSFSMCCLASAMFFSMCRAHIEQGEADPIPVLDGVI